ncbi:hypothetical protein ABPG77_001221 [Micractinium sp. CCAP 211/92]
MVRLCGHCGMQRAVLRRPKTAEQLCRECFYAALEEEVHQTITGARLFRPGERVAVAASGGKDSTVLAHMLTTLNARYNYGLDLFLLSIDEGISGYRDDSLETVKRNEETYQIPLHVFSYKDLYGWTMDEIVREIGTRSNCTFCGVFRRQALDRGAALVKADKIATGHNADDVAETVLLNIIRGDVPRLGRCANIVTGEDSPLPRVKPFKYTYEKEIVMYAYFKKLDYFSTECIYAPFAARGFAREFVKDLEAARPRAIVDLIRSAEQFRVPGLGDAAGTTALPQPGSCERCGYISSQPVCKACLLLEGLNKGLPRLGVSRTRRAPKAAKPGPSQAESSAAPAAAAAEPAVMQGASDAAAAAVAQQLNEGCCRQQHGACGPVAALPPAQTVCCRGRACGATSSTHRQQHVGRQQEAQHDEQDLPGAGHAAAAAAAAAASGAPAGAEPAAGPAAAPCSLGGQDGGFSYLQSKAAIPSHPSARQAGAAL